MRAWKNIMAAGLVALALGGGSAARAGSVVPLSNDQILATADSIVQGTVLESACRATGTRGEFIVTDYVVRLDRVLSDAGTVAAQRRADNTIVLTFAGGQIGELGLDVSGVPRLEVGDRAFFFLTASRQSFTPLVGLSHGLFRIRDLGDGDRVVREDTCCANAQPLVRAPFLSKVIPAGSTGFTPDQFAQEIQRALPLVRALPALRCVEPPKMSRLLEGKAFQGDQLPRATPAAAGSGGFDPTIAPAPMLPQIAVPQPQMRVEMPASSADATRLTEHSTYGARFGFFRLPQNTPIVFNIPPLMYPAWGNGFQESAAYWNSYASGVFAHYANANNTLTALNGRNETGFLDNPSMILTYGSGWDANTLAVCLSWSVSNRIIESDILFNTAWTWTNDRETAYANAGVIYFQPVSLHEQGHAFGREHSWVSDPGYALPSIMNYWALPFYSTEVYRVFADDAESIRAAYPARTVTRNDALLTMWSMAGAMTTGNNDVLPLSMPASAPRGGSFLVRNMYAENVGTLSREISVDFWLCPIPRSFSGAVYAGTSTIGTFPRFSVGSFDRTVSVPSDCPGGSYYLCAALTGGDDNNNNSQAWSRNPITITVPPPPAPPGNDMRFSARSIPMGTALGNTTYATPDGTATCGSSNGTPDIWYRLYTPYAGTLVVDTCGSSFDTVVSLQAYSYLYFPPRMVEVACDDDGAACGGNRSQASTGVARSEEVFIRVSGYNGAVGDVQLNVRVIPSNDECFSAVAISEGTSYGNTNAATVSAASASCFFGNTPDVWYTYTPSCDGVFTLDTVSTAFDTLLAVYTDCGMTEVGCNDDVGPRRQAALSVEGFAGFTYYIRVGGFDGARGSVVLDLSPPVPNNDQCAGAYGILDGTWNVSTLCAATQGVELSGDCLPGASVPVADVWYAYYPPFDGIAQVSFCDLSFDAVAAAYAFSEGCPADSTGQLACAALTQACPGSPSLEFPVLGGQAYYVRIGGYTGGPIGVAQGSGTFTVQTVLPLPANDSCESASDLGTVAFAQFSGSLAGATQDGSSAGDPIEGAGPDVWLHWTAPCDGIFTISTCGTMALSGTDTMISLHLSCPGTPGSEVAYGVQNLGMYCPTEYVDDAETVLNVTAGLELFIRIAAEHAGAAAGAFVGQMQFYTQADSVYTPVPIATGMTSFCTYGATPDDLGDGFEMNDLWHLYTAECSGTAAASLCGSPIDTRLAIYDFDAINGVIGAQIAFNDDNGPGCFGTAASLTFPSIEGSAYLIRTGSAADAQLTLELTCTPDSTPCPADFNQDGGVDGSDIDAFFAAWESGDSAADVNFDGGVDGSDVEAFFAVWEAGGC